MWKLWAGSICGETSVKRIVNRKPGQQALRLRNEKGLVRSGIVDAILRVQFSQLNAMSCILGPPRVEEAFPSRNERGAVPHTAGGLSCDGWIDDDSHTEEEGRYAYPEPKQEVVSLR